MKGTAIVVAWVEFTATADEAAASAPGGVVSGTRTACPIRFRFLENPKHQDMLKQLPHLFFCRQQMDLNFSLRRHYHTVWPGKPCTHYRCIKTIGTK